MRANDSGLTQLVHPAIEFLIDDTNPGYFAMAAHLSQLIVIGLLRSYILSKKEHSAIWNRVIQDPKISKALTALHSDPQRKWTVQSLAEYTALSRTSFASRFSKLFGQPPIDYLNQWRAQLAADLLINSSLPMSEIANQVGFQSDRLLRLSFKQRMGQSPRGYRKAYKTINERP